MKRFVAMLGSAGCALAVVASGVSGAPAADAKPAHAAESANARGQRSDLLSLAELLPNPTIIHPDIAAQVQVDLSGLGSLATDLSASRGRERAAVAAGLRARTRAEHLDSLEREAARELLDAESEVDAAEGALQVADRNLGSFAVGTFVGDTALTLERFRTDTGPSPIPTLAADAEVVLVESQQDAAVRLARANDERERRNRVVVSLRAEAEAVAQRIDSADGELAAASGETARLQPLFEAALRTAPVDGVDFPVVVLDAYYRASLRTAEQKPWCGVRWDQLAGIGRVESHHGTYGGKTVQADGRTDGEILGPVLDGTRFASIPDTDGGQYDGDVVWDRAVGPMQFIPGSWRIFGADGNGDGDVDPHNMYDAAMAAANHLCGSTGDLGAPANFQRALLGYNRSVPYGQMVMGLADGYRASVSLAPSADSVADPEPPQQSAALRSDLSDG